ncbi:putative non-specific serine/threonine protein kinase [Lupinus albus]|uniref:Putative non-specific serine/threonine protein kinase n=1 Tax=Lupinus albus TaxID=3870 RepID=A0A6A4R0H8_LUPAL|nr:putative non-specific serine/threonine protein kinase [Lupinus albus]
MCPYNIILYKCICYQLCVLNLSSFLPYFRDLMNFRVYQFDQRKSKNSNYGLFLCENANVSFSFLSLFTLLSYVFFFTHFLVLPERERELQDSYCSFVKMKMPASVFFLFALICFLCSVESVSMSMPFALSERAQMRLGQPSSMSSVAHGPPPFYQGPSVTTTPKRHHHRPNMQPYAMAPSLSKGQACDPICTDPLTATPFGSPCGCVFPMKVRLILDIAPLPIFPVINQLEIEVASGTYLKQSQVRIMGVTADSENQGRTIVDINLVPLGEKFDDITFSVICERFWHKKVPLNKSLFGDFAVLSITYPEMPASAPHGTFARDGHHPNPRYGAAGLIPFTANVISSENQKMCPRTIIIIALSSFVLLLVLVGALSILYKWRKVRRPSSAIGPAIATSLNTRPGISLNFFCICLCALAK